MPVFAVICSAYVCKKFEHSQFSLIFVPSIEGWVAGILCVNFGDDRLTCFVAAAVPSFHTGCRRRLLYTVAVPRECVYAGNESVPIQLAQCRLPGLAISSARI